jgi:hypothetical protein
VEKPLEAAARDGKTVERIGTYVFGKIFLKIKEYLKLQNKMIYIKSVSFLR